MECKAGSAQINLAATRLSKDFRAGPTIVPASARQAAPRFLRCSPPMRTADPGRPGPAFEDTCGRPCYGSSSPVQTAGLRASLSGFCGHSRPFFGGQLPGADRLIEPSLSGFCGHSRRPFPGGSSPTDGQAEGVQVRLLRTPSNVRFRKAAPCCERPD